MRDARVSEKTNIERYIGDLYPKLATSSIDLEISIASAPSAGVALADNIYYDCVPPADSKGIVLAKKIPHKFLGFLDRIAAIVTIGEDRSTHTSIVCRAQGVPIANLSPSDFLDLASKAKAIELATSFAVDTFQGKILAGEMRLDTEHVVSARRDALAFLKESIPLKVNANADTAQELKHAVALGFGHAWPRSETLLYDQDTLPYFIAFLLDPNNQIAREKFVECHTNEVRKLFNEARGTKVAFRLLDPPSHEFLPSIQDEEQIGKVAKILERSVPETCDLIKDHMESNPMIGHRGARLLLTNKEMLRAQANSMFVGWKDADPLSRPPAVEILVPFVMLPSEMRAIKTFISKVHSENMEFSEIPVKYGCMIEVPSILDYPEEIAVEVDFISFGTNDLVSVTHGIARGDAYGRYLATYIQEGLIDIDPFSVLPQNVVDKIQKFCLAVKNINPAITTDICGEQALNTDLTTLVSSGALNAVSIGTENLPILLRSLIESGLLSVPARNERAHAAPSPASIPG